MLLYPLLKPALHEVNTEAQTKARKKNVKLYFMDDFKKYGYSANCFITTLISPVEHLITNHTLLSMLA